MTEKPTGSDPSPSEDPGVHIKVKKLKCRRTGQMFTVAEHVECPYCSGDEKTIEEGRPYEEFCEFQAGKDPINFGFPPDSTRTQRG